MNTHKTIDERSLALAARIVERIDLDPRREGLTKARATCRHWQHILTGNQKACADEWFEILQKPWEDIRDILLDPGEEAMRLRQNTPFCGILSNTERWNIIKEHRDRDTRAA
jgi:hypothetical protein